MHDAFRLSGRQIARIAIHRNKQWFACFILSCAVFISSAANAQFVDDFDRPDNAALGNGWIEKTPSAFDLNNGAARKLFISSDYRDNIVYRPASENALDIEASLEFRLTSGSPGYPQLLTRVLPSKVSSRALFNVSVSRFKSKESLVALSRCEVSAEGSLRFALSIHRHCFNVVSDL